MSTFTSIPEELKEELKVSGTFFLADSFNKPTPALAAKESFPATGGVPARRGSYFLLPCPEFILERLYLVMATEEVLLTCSATGDPF